MFETPQEHEYSSPPKSKKKVNRWHKEQGNEPSVEKEHKEEEETKDISNSAEKRLLMLRSPGGENGEPIPLVYHNNDESLEINEVSERDFDTFQEEGNTAGSDESLSSEVEPYYDEELNREGKESNMGLATDDFNDREDDFYEDTELEQEVEEKVKEVEDKDLESDDSTDLAEENYQSEDHSEYLQKKVEENEQRQANLTGIIAEKQTELKKVIGEANSAFVLDFFRSKTKVCCELDSS